MSIRRSICSVISRGCCDRRSHICRSCLHQNARRLTGPITHWIVLFANRTFARDSWRSELLWSHSIYQPRYLGIIHYLPYTIFCVRGLRWTSDAIFGWRWSDAGFISHYIQVRGQVIVKLAYRTTSKDHIYLSAIPIWDVCRGFSWNPWSCIADGIELRIQFRRKQSNDRYVARITLETTSSFAWRVN